MKNIHRTAGGIAMLTIATFWIATVVVEVFAGPEMIRSLKQAILWGMLLLIPAIIITGASGFKLAGNHGGHFVNSKKKRMPIIAANGLIVLVPSALFLASRATAGHYDSAFYVVQAIELTAGAVNFALLSMNMRDGLRMRGKLRRA